MAIYLFSLDFLNSVLLIKLEQLCVNSLHNYYNQEKLKISWRYFSSYGACYVDMTEKCFVNNFQHSNYAVITNPFFCSSFDIRQALCR